MSGFEFSFGLISLLLGLGFAHVAAAFASLILLGKRVRWDWLSPLAALLFLQSALIYWWFQWALREQEVVLGDLAIRGVACLTLYIMAVAVFPETRGRRADLREHFERSRLLVYGSFITYTLIVGILPIVARLFNTDRPLSIPWFQLISLVLLIAGCFIRKRWYDTILLSYLVVILGIRWLPQALAA